MSKRHFLNWAALALLLGACDRHPKAEIASPAGIMKPEERVTAYIRDWHKCWMDQGNGHPPTPEIMTRMEFFTRWETDMANLDAIHWTTGSGHSSSFSIPPEHDPAVEKIVSVSDNGDTARIETKQDGWSAMPKFTEYNLVREKDTWKITSKLDFYDEENTPAFSDTELNAWLAKANVNAKPPPADPDDSPNCEMLFRPGQIFKGDAMRVPAAVEVRRAGKITVPCGAMVVRDFSYGPDDARPLSLKVAPGDYEVEVALLENTIAAVRILLESGAQGPFTYRRAVTVDGNHSMVGVDAGNVCLGDARAFMSRTKRGHERDYDAWVKSTLQVRGADDISFLKLDGSEVPNAVVVHSGHGDGGYPAFWMFDQKGKPVALVVDFLIAAEFPTVKTRVSWKTGVSGVIFDETKSGGLRVRISDDDGVAVSGASIKSIRWLGRDGVVVGDNSSVGSWSSGEEQGWNVDLAKFADKAVEMEVEYYRGYRNRP